MISGEIFRALDHVLFPEGIGPGAVFGLARVGDADPVGELALGRPDLPGYDTRGSLVHRVECDVDVWRIAECLVGCVEGVDVAVDIEERVVVIDLLEANGVRVRRTTHVDGGRVAKTGRDRDGVHRFAARGGEEAFT